jgi:hypothetical protein
VTNALKAFFLVKMAFISVPYSYNDICHDVFEQMALAQMLLGQMSVQPMLSE